MCKNNMDIVQKSHLDLESLKQTIVDPNDFQLFEIYREMLNAVISEHPQIAEDGMNFAKQYIPLMLLVLSKEAEYYVANVPHTSKSWLLATKFYAMINQYICSQGQKYKQTQTTRNF